MTAVLFPLFIKEQRREVEDKLHDTAVILKAGLATNDLSFLDDIQSEIIGMRMTIIDKSGAVVFDNQEDISTLDNHANRQEVHAAFQDGSGQSRRLSATLSQELYYYALKLDDTHVLRVAVATSSVYQSAGRIAFFGLAYLALLGVILFYITSRQTNRLVAPINNMDLERLDVDEVYDELLPLVRRIGDQQKEITQQVTTLNERNKTFAAITNAMHEGLFLLDSYKRIIFMNTAAERILQITYTEKLPFIQYVRNDELQAIIGRATNGEQITELIKLHEQYHLISVSPLREQGVAVLLQDVHEKTLHEDLRRSFSANVSHELKTPLQSISGYAELIEMGIAEEHKIPEFAKKIHEESLRLLTLINEIILLSKIDEGNVEQQEELVRIEDVVASVLQKLQSRLKVKEIQVTTDVEHFEMMGSKTLLYELIFNLCENALKYGRVGGKLAVQLETLDEGALLVITDDGIGIPKDMQERIFERFYRATTSIDGEIIEGTGIGLSLVKHIAQHYGITIHVESAVGDGTRVELLFPEQ